jgi:hypothetical protein
MNGQYIGDRFNTSENDEETDKDTNSPVKNSDPFADKTPVDPALIHETPMGGTLPSVGPLDEPVVDEVPMFETPDQEIPMGGTVAAVGPMKETFVHEDQWGETIPYKAPVVETIPYKAPVVETIPYKAPMGETITHEAPIGTIAASSATLLNREESEHFRTRWNEIQGKFVDEPREAVQQADALVTEVIEQIAQMFDNEHSSLEGQWNQGNEVSTEDLRKALKCYRSFFNRLVV